MNTPTPYLDLLLLAATAFPAGFIASLSSLFTTRPQTGVGFASLWVFLGTLASLIALGSCLKPALVFLYPAPPLVLLAAVLAGPCLLYVEYVTGAALVYASTGRWGRGLSLNAAWRAGVSPRAAILSTAVAVGEEIIYRQFWFSLLAGFGLPPLVVLLVHLHSRRPAA